MAGPFYVDDGGDGSTENSWATADTSINALDAEYTFASGEIVYFGHDSVCQASNSGSLTITGPTSGLPVKFVSATQGSDPPTYQEATADQIDTTEGAYSITFDGSFAIYGLQVESGGGVTLQADANESFLWRGGKIKLAANNGLLVGSASTASQQRIVVEDVEINCAADGTTNRANAAIVAAGQTAELRGLTFASVGYRTGGAIEVPGNNGVVFISGCDFSNFDYATKGCEIFNSAASSGLTVITNCLTADTWLLKVLTEVNSSGGIIMGTNIGPADAPTALYYHTAFGNVISTTAIYRSDGAVVDGVNTGWLVTTTASCGDDAPLYTPWIYGVVSSTGSKTFDLYITHDADTTFDADFTDAQVWLEVEYLSTSDEAIWALATDQRATITATAAAQTDDTTSTWNGAGPSYTYKQKLSVTATVNETGQFRARVAIGAAGIGSAHYFYVDPDVYVDGVKAGSGAYLIPGAGIVEYSGAHPRVGDRTGGLR